MPAISKTRINKQPPKLPISWLIPLALLAITYAVVQPWANARLGLRLPSLIQLVSPDQGSKTADRANQSEVSVRDSEDTVSDKSITADKRQTDRENLNPPKRSSSGTSTDSSSSSATTSERASKSQSIPEANASGETSSPYNILKNVGNEVYVSDAGIRYTRGSEEGHRIKHLERHLSDIPDRPGVHGVFKGNWKQTLEWIDEAYRRSSKPDKKTNVRKENNRSIIETEFESPIGFQGGREGARKGNPPARRLRVVMEGDRLITAFPF